MAQVKFVNRVKYDGVWHDAYTSFYVADKDIPKLVEKGAIITKPPTSTPEKSLDEMKVDELVAYAARNGIDIEGITKKADIKAAIESAERSYQ